MKENKIISIFDTSIASYNIGNQIIMDAINLELKDMFPQAFFIKLPTEDIKKNARKYNYISNSSFVGGTNILNSDIRKYRQWDLSFHNIYRLSNIILMGCGWYQYENIPVTTYTKWAFNRILSKKYIHSVRDEYTKRKLEKIGIKAINTGCPTIWRLDQNILKSISPIKKNKVVITLTDYNRKPQRDKELLRICFQEYSEVYLFPQGTGDINYIKELGFLNDINFVEPNVESFNKLLESGEVDYIGTRLHAGIRALQKSVRSFIIGIDNRATEMSLDFNLPVINETRLSKLPSKINEKYSLELNIPWNAIKEWKSQFK